MLCGWVPICLESVEIDGAFKGLRLNRRCRLKRQRKKKRYRREDGMFGHWCIPIRDLRRRSSVEKTGLIGGGYDAPGGTKESDETWREEPKRERESNMNKGERREGQ